MLALVPMPNDRVLVECYANEVACAGGLSESVSYGWALDAFLADPTEFRARVRSVRQSSDVASFSAASTTDKISGTKSFPQFALAPRGFSSKYCCVSWKKSNSKWQVIVRQMSGVLILIGCFESEDEVKRSRACIRQLCSKAQSQHAVECERRRRARRSRARLCVQGS